MEAEGLRLPPCSRLSQVWPPHPQDAQTPRVRDSVTPPHDVASGEASRGSPPVPHTHQDRTRPANLLLTQNPEGEGAVVGEGPSPATPWSAGREHIAGGPAGRTPRPPRERQATVAQATDVGRHATGEGRRGGSVGSSSARNVGTPEIPSSRPTRYIQDPKLTENALYGQHPNPQERQALPHPRSRCCGGAGPREGSPPHGHAGPPQRGSRVDQRPGL